MRLLLAEDDQMVGKYTRQGLLQAGFTVDWTVDGHSTEHSIGHTAYLASILDLGLPSKDGLSVLTAIRAAGNQVPVLILTARDAVSDRVAGLNAGADDYLVKPFDLEELIARVHALIRRRSGSGRPQLVHGNLVLDPLAKSVTLRGAPVELSSRELAILQALMRDPGAVLSRDVLEDAVYGWHQEVSSNAVEVHLHHLRRKLGADAIKNIRGVGYRIGLT